MDHSKIKTKGTRLCSVISSESNIGCFYILGRGENTLINGSLLTYIVPYKHLTICRSIMKPKGIGLNS